MDEKIRDPLGGIIVLGKDVVFRIKPEDDVDSTLLLRLRTERPREKAAGYGREQKKRRLEEMAGNHAGALHRIIPLHSDRIGFGRAKTEFSLSERTKISD